MLCRQQPSLPQRTSTHVSCMHACAPSQPAPPRQSLATSTSCALPALPVAAKRPRNRKRNPSATCEAPVPMCPHCSPTHVPLPIVPHPSCRSPAPVLTPLALLSVCAHSLPVLVSPALGPTCASAAVVCTPHTHVPACLADQIATCMLDLPHALFPVLSFIPCHQYYAAPLERRRQMNSQRSAREINATD